MYYLTCGFKVSVTDRNICGLNVSDPDIPVLTAHTFYEGEHIYYSKFAKDHTMLVMEQSRNGSHPETH